MKAPADTPPAYKEEMMPNVRMKMGPYRGKVVPVFAHEVGALVATGQAEEVTSAPPPAEAPAKAEAATHAPAKKSSRRK